MRRTLGIDSRLTGFNFIQFIFVLMLIHKVSYAQSLAKARFTEFESFVNEEIEEGKLGGAITMVSKNNEIIHFKSYGYCDVENGVPMSSDIMIPIASMTKIITSIAVLQLVDQGVLDLDSPVERYVPEFSDLTVLKDTMGLLVEDVRNKPTIRDLMRHTSGMVYGGENTYTDTQYVEAGFRTWERSLHEFVVKVAEIPLAFHPNEDWDYSYSHDILGYIIQEVSGLSLDHYLETKIFAPMGLDFIGFCVPENRSHLLSSLYRFENNRLLLEDDRDSSIYTKCPKALSGGGGWWSSYGGLVATIEEFHEICRVLLDFGKYNGMKLLSSRSVESMISNQIGQHNAFRSKYGLGVGVIQGASASHEDVIVYWSGAPYNTHFWIDYSDRTIGILYTNTAPFGHLDIRNKFRKMVSSELAQRN